MICVTGFYALRCTFKVSCCWTFYHFLLVCWVVGDARASQKRFWALWRTPAADTIWTRVEKSVFFFFFFFLSFYVVKNSARVLQRIALIMVPFESSVSDEKYVGARFFHFRLKIFSYNAFKKSYHDLLRNFARNYHFSPWTKHLSGISLEAKR